MLFIALNIFDWLQNNVVTDTRPIDAAQLTFPAVTLCLSTSDHHGTKSLQLNSDVFLGGHFDNLANQVKCALDDFIELKSYFNFTSCYRYNSGSDKHGNEKSLLQLDNTGPFTGLSLYLSLPHNSQVNLFLTDNRVSVSYRDLFYNIAAQRSTILRVEQVRENKLPKPYNPCEADVASHESPLVQQVLSRNLTYRRVTCLDLCHDAHARKAVGLAGFYTAIRGSREKGQRWVIAI
jgi:hypothetical protein